MPGWCRVVVWSCGRAVVWCGCTSVVNRGMGVSFGKLRALPLCECAEWPEWRFQVDGASLEKWRAAKASAPPVRACVCYLNIAGCLAVRSCPFSLRGWVCVPRQLWQSRLLLLRGCVSSRGLVTPPRCTDVVVALPRAEGFARGATTRGDACAGRRRPTRCCRCGGRPPRCRYSVAAVAAAARRHRAAVCQRM
jgi:hypothetical protein